MSLHIYFIGDDRIKITRGSITDEESIEIDRDEIPHLIELLEGSIAIQKVDPYRTWLDA